MYILLVKCIGTVNPDDQNGGKLADDRAKQSKSNNKYDSLNINWKTV